MTISRSGYYKWKNRKTDSIDSEIDALRRRINNSQKLFRVEINLDIKNGERRVIEKVFNNIECGNADFEHNKIPPKDYFVARYIYFRLSKQCALSKIDALRFALGGSNDDSSDSAGDILDQVRSELDLYLDSYFQARFFSGENAIEINKDNYDRLVAEIASHIAFWFG